MSFLVFCTCAILVSYWFHRHRKKTILSLDWPEFIGYYKFNRFVARYLRYHGWEVRRVLLLDHDISAVKPGQTVKLRCCSSQTLWSTTTLRDITSEIRLLHPKPIVYVTADALPRMLIANAPNGAIIIHYKELVIFSVPSINILDVARLFYKSLQSDPGVDIQDIATLQKAPMRKVNP